MGTSGHTGEIGFPFAIDPSPEQVTLAPGGAPVRVGVRVRPVGKAGAGQVRVVVGVDPESGLTFPHNSLTVDTTDYPAGADARDDVLSFEAVTIDSEGTPELSVEVTAGEQTPPEPTAVSFAVGSASCSVPVTIAGDE
ncbi:hypothetical protein ACFRAQ_08210 [Nocardia sp. NPDC056611]|uniref:hypothetical protein n=1 Tax=Nocardia sp. NPDC056611 TaxID=3345877 RepID=UPI003672DB6D